MRNLEIMSRSKVLQQEMEKFYRLDEEYKDLKNKCRHEIIVITYTDTWRLQKDACCLFCGKNFDSTGISWGTHSINGGIYIDVSKYRNEKMLDEQLTEEVQKTYEEIVSKNGEISSDKIVKIIQDKFKEKYECK